jgi:hypothetical protein
VPVRDSGSFFSAEAEVVSPLSRAYTRPPRSLILEKHHKKHRTRRFEQTLEALSTHISQVQSKRPSSQVRSSTWLYIFDLATCPEQLEHASRIFSQFIESGRQFRGQHGEAFVRAYSSGMKYIQKAGHN